MTSYCCSRVYSIFTFITWEADFDKSYHSQFILRIAVLLISQERKGFPKNECMFKSAILDVLGCFELVIKFLMGL